MVDEALENNDVYEGLAAIEFKEEDLKAGAHKRTPRGRTAPPTERAHYFLRKTRRGKSSPKSQLIYVQKGPEFPEKTPQQYLITSIGKTCGPAAGVFKGKDDYKGRGAWWALRKAAMADCVRDFMAANFKKEKKYPLVYGKERGWYKNDKVIEMAKQGTQEAAEKIIEEYLERVPYYITKTDLDKRLAAEAARRDSAESKFKKFI